MAFLISLKTQAGDAEAKAFSLVLGFPEQLCGGAFFAENAHEICGVEIHP